MLPCFPKTFFLFRRWWLHLLQELLLPAIQSLRTTSSPFLHWFLTMFKRCYLIVARSLKYVRSSCFTFLLSQGKEKKQTEPRSIFCFPLIPELRPIYFLKTFDWIDINIPEGGTCFAYCSRHISKLQQNRFKNKWTRPLHLNALNFFWIS